MKLPAIVGIAGTNAAGKDTLGHLRAKLSNAKMVSLSDILRHELDKRGIPHEREHLHNLSAEWRAESGPGVLVDKTIEEYEQEKATRGWSGLSITSVRNPYEAKAIQAAGGIVLWIDADPTIRYQRIVARGTGRPEDQKTYEQFLSEEKVEMYPANPDDPTVLNMSAVRDLANLTVINEFATEKEYEDYLIKEFELGA